MDSFPWTRISSFSNHTSIQMIKDKYQNIFNFKFKSVITDQFIKFIDEIDCNKSSNGDIPAKTIKITKEEIAEPIVPYQQIFSVMNKKYLTLFLF